MSPAGRTVAQFDIYGRGRGSDARQEMHLTVRLPRATIEEHRLGPGDRLDIVTETLEGERITLPDLELVEARPRDA